MTKLEQLRKLAVNIKVLYVEDNEVARKKTSKMLSRIFDNIDIAIHGKEGLHLYMKSKHDLIISDIIMNVMDGLEMSKVIKEVNPEQSIVFLSAYTEQRFLTKAIELGVDGFVFKPIDKDKLYAVLEKSLNQILLKKENFEYKQNLEKLVEERSNDLIVKNYELEELLKEVRKNNQLKEEMKVAQQVQENFLPKEIPQSTKMQVATFFEAAQYVGGDYYDLFYSGEHVINIMIADVSGHGIAPAITMSTFRGVCRSILGLDISFEEQIFLINNLMCEDSKHSDFFITAFFIKYYEKEHRFEYISTGHNEMLLYKKDEDSLEELKSTAIPLGIFAGTQYEAIKKQIKEDDFLVLYTDGLIESTNKSYEMFELKSLKEIVQKSKDLDANEILVNIQSSLDEFIEDEAKEDDTTSVIVKFL